MVSSIFKGTSEKYVFSNFYKNEGWPTKSGVASALLVLKL